MTTFRSTNLATVFPAEGEHRGHVAMLAGCIASVSFADLNRATVRVLAKNGVSVVIPADQRCCGALHAHAGRLDEARALAQTKYRCFLDESIDAIVTNAARMRRHAEGISRPAQG